MIVDLVNYVDVYELRVKSVMNWLMFFFDINDEDFLSCYELVDIGLDESNEIDLREDLVDLSEWDLIDIDESDMVISYVIFGEIIE